VIVLLVASGLVVAALGTYLVAGNMQKEGADKLGTTDIFHLEFISLSVLKHYKGERPVTDKIRY
jgi:hypothetical protein